MAPKAKKSAAGASALSEDRAAAALRAAAGQPITLRGSLDRADPTGHIEGWCWSPDEPAVRRTVAVLIDGVEAGRVRAETTRPDLLAAGVGDGGHSFVFAFDPAALAPERSAEVRLLDVASGQPVGAGLRVHGRAAGRVTASVAPSPAPALAGSLDRVSRDGWVSGWCWYPDRPQVRVALRVLVDDEEVGSVVADAFRPDLQQAGIGDGAHGFHFALPYAALSDRGSLTVAVQERETGRALGDPITMRIGRMALAEERIQDLERQLRLLRGQVEEAQRVAAERAEDRAARELFATVAAFFQNLADGGARQGEVMLAGTLAEVSARCPAITLAHAAMPRATICIPATAPVETVYRCLVALHDAGADREAEILVLDDGATDPANALLPTVVRNLRYEYAAGAPAPGVAALAEAANILAASAPTSLLIWLAPQARLGARCLAEWLATFAEEPDAVAVGARLLREDGRLHGSALRLRPDGMLSDASHLAPADAPDWQALRRVDALTGGAVAFRREAFVAAGGLSNLYRGPAHAMVELCARLRAAGGAVLLQPLATVFWADATDRAVPVEPPDLRMSDEDTLRLRERVLATGWPAPTTAEVGRALVIDDDLPRPDRDAGSIATLEQMLVLRRAGWHVTFAPVHGGPVTPEAAEALARRGIAVAAPPHWPSVTAYLEREGNRLDLVHVYRYANAAMLAARVRELAPQARLVLATADLHHLREARRAAVAGQPPAEATRDAELAAIRDADATIVTNDYEHALLTASPEVAGARIALLRWIARPKPPAQSFGARRDICFVGNFRHPPNLDGIGWFVAEVLPRLRANLPGIRLLLAGSDMPACAGSLAADGVELLGWVPDLAELFGRVRVSVAPLRFGAGFKGKVATSLAHGVPVVGSAISLEGTGLCEGDGVAAADTPEAFTQAIVRLHEDEAVWQAQSARALERVAALYSPDRALEIWRGLLADLGLPAAA